MPTALTVEPVSVADLAAMPALAAADLSDNESDDFALASACACNGNAFDRADEEDAVGEPVGEGVAGENSDVEAHAVAEGECDEVAEADVDADVAVNQDSLDCVVLSFSPSFCQRSFSSVLPG